MKLHRVSSKQLRATSIEISQLALECSYKAKTGHIGSALSIVDILTVLYFDTMHISAALLDSSNRDRFILSKGHAAAALYAALYKKGILSKELFYSFGQEDGGLCEHPEIHDPGIEMSAGSLGHGLAFGVGIAYGLLKQKKQAHVFVLISDGECGEGSVWEAAMAASHLNLQNLTVIIDYNHWQCFGKTDEIQSLEPFTDKWKAFGWRVLNVDGHNISQLQKALQKKKTQTKKPTCIIARTIAGKGIPVIEDQLIGHYKVLSETEYIQAFECLKQV